jgi:hypothetical protein
MKMSADFVLKQHLKLNINGVVKNFVVEALDDIPPKEEWRIGRIWYNKNLNKIQYITYKTDNDGNILDEMVVKNIDDGILNFPADHTFLDGLFQFTPKTKISDAIDEINEALKDLAPAEATTLRGNLILNNVYKSGYLSNNIPNDFNIKDFKNGKFINYIVLNEKINCELPKQGVYEKGKQQLQFGKADEGEINLLLNDENILSVSLKNAFYEPSRDIDGAIQGYDYPIEQKLVINGEEKIIEVNPNKDKFKDENEKGELIISKVEKYNNFKKFQRGEGRFSVGLIKGENALKVIHKDVLGGPYETKELKVFYEPKGDEIELNLNNLKIIGNKKYLSGIGFLNNNIKVSFDLDIKNLFKYTYYLNPIKIKLPYMIEKEENWKNDASNLKDKDIPNYDDELKFENYVLNYDANNVQMEGIIVNIKAERPTDIKSISETLNVLIDTKQKTSENYVENFDDEYYRLSQNIDFDNTDEIKNNINNWKSDEKLGDTDAQVYLGKLIKAKDKFGDIDYTNNVNNNQVYIRPFIFDKPSSNGKIKIITENNLGQDFDLYMKIPGVTGWLDLSKYFDVEDFDKNYKNDGTGCATEINKKFNEINVKWTIGTHSLNESDNMYLIKIVIKEKNTEIEKIEEISDNLA